MKRQNPNDTINILDSLHRLDIEGDRTKDEERLRRFFVAELMRKIRPGFIILFMKDVEGNKACGLTPAVTRGNIPARAASKLKAAAERASRKFRIRSYPNGEAGLRRAGVRNALVVPLGTHKAEGVFVLGNKEGGFSDSDRRLADEIESAADSILEHARDYNQLQQRKNELEVLYKIDRIRDSSDSFDEMIDRVHSELVKITDAQRGFIVLYDMLGRMKVLKLQPPALKDESASPPAAPGPAPDKKTILNICRTACSHGQLVCRNEAKYRNIKNWMAIPLILKDTIIGVFGAMNSKRGRFSRHQTDLLRAIGSQIDTAIFENREITLIKNIFKRYVSDKVVEKMLKVPDSQFLTGQRQEISILFSDIRRFTDLSEELEPEMLVRTINEYIETMAEEIFRQDGTIDKIVGDEVMALFGAPVFRKDHAATAVATAITMQSAMKRLQRRWRRQGRPAPFIGIGINSGNPVVGNIGYEKVSDYTALGVSVNIAARLCGKAGPGQILISESTHRAIGRRFKTRRLDPVEVKGIRHPLEVHEVLT